MYTKWFGWCIRLLLLSSFISSLPLPNEELVVIVLVAVGTNVTNGVRAPVSPSTRTIRRSPHSATIRLVPSVERSEFRVSSTTREALPRKGWVGPLLDDEDDTCLVHDECWSFSIPPPEACPNKLSGQVPFFLSPSSTLTPPISFSPLLLFSLFSRTHNPLRHPLRSICKLRPIVIGPPPTSQRHIRPDRPTSAKRR